MDTSPFTSTLPIPDLTPSQSPKNIQTYATPPLKLNNPIHSPSTNETNPQIPHSTPFPDAQIIQLENEVECLRHENKLLRQSIEDMQAICQQISHAFHSLEGAFADIEQPCANDSNQH